MADETRKLNHTASELDAAVDMLLEVYTREEIDGLLAQKVTAVPGSGLITDEEREKLAVLENYDDSEVKSQTALNRSTLGYQRKNLLKNAAVSQTIRGMTFTVNKDGSVTANGTATATADISISTKLPILNGDYTLTCCPAGGSADSYRAIARIYDSEDNPLTATLIDTGEGLTVTGSDDSYINVIIRISSGVTAENLTFRPMLRYAEITDGTYEPYKPSVEERLAALEAVIAGGES